MTYQESGVVYRQTGWVSFVLDSDGSRCYRTVKNATTTKTIKVASIQNQSPKTCRSKQHMSADAYIIANLCSPNFGRIDGVCSFLRRVSLASIRKCEGRCGWSNSANRAKNCSFAFHRFFLLATFSATSHIFPECKQIEKNLYNEACSEWQRAQKYRRRPWLVRLVSVIGDGVTACV